MAYEQGTATDPLDLIGKLRTFVTANGWTEDNYGTRTGGAGSSGQALQVHKGSVYLTFLTDNGAGSSADPGKFIGVYAHDTYSGGNGTENQSNGSTKVYTNNVSGPFLAYHFVTLAEGGSDSICVVLETSAGTFKHFGGGTLVKLGAVTTGAFAFASRWSYTGSVISDSTSTRHAVPFDCAEDTLRNGASTQVRADGDAVSPRWYDTLTTATYKLAGGFRRTTTPRSTVYGPMQNGASEITGRALLAPCWVAGERGSSLYSPLGYPPGMRWVRLDYLSPGDVLTLGSDQWKVFPIIRKNGGSGQPNSAGFGYAYKVA